MKRIAYIQTSDGRLHRTEADATHHAELRYTEAAYDVAGALCNLIHGHGKVCDIATWLDENLGRFDTLKALKSDLSPP